MGLRDNYVALTKARILKELIQVHIVDISHEIEKFNIIQAAYVFGNSYSEFPEGTVHVLGIKSGSEKNQRYLAIEIEKQIILCPDNGIFTLFHDLGKPTTIKEIPKNSIENNLFFVKDILIDQACKIIKDNTYFQSLPHALNHRQILNYQPTSTSFTITGRCIYVDGYGNVITNIKKSFFEESRKGRSFTIFLPGLKIKKISKDYEDVPEINPLAIFNNAGYLEIAVNKGQAKQLLFQRNFNSHNDFNLTIEFSE